MRVFFPMSWVKNENNGKYVFQIVTNKEKTAPRV